jgi:hypothetical protein
MPNNGGRLGDSHSTRYKGTFRASNRSGALFRVEDCVTSAALNLCCHIAHSKINNCACLSLRTVSRPPSQSIIVHCAATIATASRTNCFILSIRSDASLDINHRRQRSEPPQATKPFCTDVLIPSPPAGPFPVNLIGASGATIVRCGNEMIDRTSNLRKDSRWTSSSKLA